LAKYLSVFIMVTKKNRKTVNLPFRNLDPKILGLYLVLDLWILICSDPVLENLDPFLVVKDNLDPFLAVSDPFPVWISDPEVGEDFILDSDPVLDNLDPFLVVKDNLDPFLVVKENLDPSLVVKNSSDLFPDLVTVV
jgi:hypothetical protein